MRKNKWSCNQKFISGIGETLFARKNDNFGTKVKYILFRNISKRKLKEYITSLGTEKITTCQATFSIWRSGPGILVTDNQLIFLKLKWIQRLLNPTNALWKDHMLYVLIELALFGQKQILTSNRPKNVQKQSNGDFFIQLLNAWGYI